MTKPIPIAVLVGGSGSNLQAIIDAIESGKLNAEIKVVLSHNPEAYALKRCEKHKLQAVIHNHKSYSNRDEFEKAVLQTIIESGVELICLAGFMRLLSPKFVARFSNKIVNIHPALLPSFPGLHAQKQAFEYGVKVSGCTVHFVNEYLDAGPIICQAIVPVKENDTEETLAAKILEQEHKIYSEAIQLIAEGRVKISGRKVLIK